MNRPKEMGAILAIFLVLMLADVPLLLWRAHNVLGVALLTGLSLVVRVVVLWAFWEGFNGARLLVMLGAAITLYSLTRWSHMDAFGHVLAVARALFALFLLWWLNTAPVRLFFRRQREPRVISGRRD